MFFPGMHLCVCVCVWLLVVCFFGLLPKPCHVNGPDLNEVDHDCNNIV
jgi:hypothetical protein